MSQAGILDIESANPQIPTSFETDSGTAVPLLNVLTINGITVVNGTYSQPLFTTGSGNDVDINIQVGSAITGAPADKNDAGLVSFDDTQFTVDANGFVQLIGGAGNAIQTVTGDDAIAVSPDGAGNINFVGEIVANGTNVKPLYIDGDIGTNTQNVELQLSSAITGAPANHDDAGICSFDDTAFVVDSNGYVTLIGGGTPMITNTGDDGIAVSPSGGGNFSWLGVTVANATHAKPVYFKDSATANALDLDVQVSAAITGSPGDKNDAGLSSFNDTQFSVDSNGYVSILGGADLPSIQTLTSDDPSAVGPDASGNIDITGEAVANATNAKPVFVDAGTNALNIEVQVAAAITGAPADNLDSGIASFNDTQFSVDANGYVSLVGGSDLPSIQTLTGDDSVATGPDASGNMDIQGLVVANATNAKPVYFNGGTNSEVCEVQVAAAITGAPGDKNDAGLASFDDSIFTVDADGYVSLATTGIATTITGDTGGALSPVANNWNILGGEGIDTSGSGATLTISGEDASDTNKGIASFQAADFDVTAGDVALEDTVVKSVGSDSGSATPSSHTFSIVGTGGISTSGSGANITIDGSGISGGISWTEVTGTSQNMVADNYYWANNASQVTMALPTTAAKNTVLRVAGYGAGGWTITQSSGQIIHYLSQDTTTGATGSITSTQRYNSIELLCTVADTEWVVLQVTGNLTVV